eukprot:13211834-Ditylum_brightwellii.AAC.1
MEVLFDAPLWITDSAETVDDKTIGWTMVVAALSYDGCADDSFDNIWRGGKSKSACHLSCAPSTQEN